MAKPPVEAYIFIEVVPIAGQELLRPIIDIKGVNKASYVNGGPLEDGSIIAEIYAKDQNSYMNTIKEINRISGVKNIYTSQVVKSVKK